MSITRKYVWFENRYRITGIVFDSIKLISNYPDSPTVGQFYYDTVSQVTLICENSPEGSPEWKEFCYGRAEIIDAD